MSARIEWQPGDVSPEARRAAEAAAEAAGMPLGDWLAEAVRFAIIRELGSLPAASELPPEVPEPEASAKPSANPEPAPSPPQVDPLAAPSAPAAASPPETMPPPPLPTGRLTTLAVADLRPAHIRSRRSTDLDPAIAALAAAVAVEGVREPILARRAAGHARSYEVVAGERRRLAAERVGCADLPAVIVQADDAEVLMLSLAENLGRADFSPLDEGRAYLRLLTEYRVTPSVLASRLARGRSHIVLTLRLLGLPDTVRRMIDGGRLAPAQAYALLSVPDPVAMAEQLVAGASPGPA
jgi:ParB/RepB/Spo0J family partition protein